MVTYINKKMGGDDRISSIQIRRIKGGKKKGRKEIEKGNKKKGGKHSLFSVVDIRIDTKKTQKPARDRVNGREN